MLHRLKQRKATKDARGKTTSYEYDAAGRRTAVVDPLNHRTVFTYDANGNQRTVTDARNNLTTFEYDDLNRRTKTIFPPAAPGETATFTTTSTADAAAVGSTNDGVCDSDPTAAVVCTLRAAVQEANSSGAGDLINLTNLGADYTLSLGGPGDNVNAGGDLRVFGPAAELVAFDTGGPRAPAVAPLWVLDASVASSGRLRPGRRPALAGGFDPVRRRRARRRFVAVLAKRCIHADALTKVVLTRGSAAGPALRRFRASAVTLGEREC